MDFLATIWNLIVYFGVAAIVILVVGRFNLGLEVTGFMGAFIAAIAIAVVSAIIRWLLVDLLNLTLPGDWVGAILGIIVAAVVLMVSDRFAPGMKVNGFVGAIVAAIAIGVIYWVIAQIFGVQMNPLPA